MAATKYETVSSYIASLPLNTQKVLKQVRAIIKKAAPGAVETISYNIPAFRLNEKNLVYYAGWKNHFSIYPVPKGDHAFVKEITAYQTGKGTLQFPLDKPIPVRLISKLVMQRIKENEMKAGIKKK